MPSQERAEGWKTLQAERLADAADSCRWPIDHLQRIAASDTRPKPPPEPEDHIRQVYSGCALAIPSPADIRSSATMKNAFHKRFQLQLLFAPIAAAAVAVLTVGLVMMRSSTPKALFSPQVKRGGSTEYPSAITLREDA